MTTLAACGERFSPAELDNLSSSVADVMVAVQRGGDSLTRHRIADSVARLHGYDDWTDLRDRIGTVATEPERLRTVMDSAQHRIELRSR